MDRLVPKNNGRPRKRKGGRVASERQLPWVGEMTALADSCHPGTGSLVIMSHTPAGWLMAATRVADTQGAISRKSDKKLGVVWSDCLIFRCEASLLVGVSVRPSVPSSSKILYYLNIDCANKY